MAIIDGIIIPSGDGDIYPKYYRQEFTSDRAKTNMSCDNFEILLTQKALENNISFLGICRGTLQHIPDYIKDSPINHEQPAPKHIVSIR